MWNTILFAVIPYLAVLIAVVGGIARFRVDRFSYSSQSSQFLESRGLFWGSVLWHYAILAILAAHVLAVVLWDPWGALVGDPTRLYTLEVIGLSLSLLALAGLSTLLVRRLVVARVRAVTTTMGIVEGPGRLLSASVKAQPSITGIIKSSSIRQGRGILGSASSASLPLAAVMTLNPFTSSAS